MKALQPSDRFFNLTVNSESIADYQQGFPPASRTIVATSGTLSYNQDGLTILTQAADNALGTSIATNKHYVPAVGQGCSFAARLRFTEAATNAANVFAGMSSSAASALVGDNGAGPAANFSGFGFYKIDGGLNWWVIASNGAVQDKLELTDAALQAVFSARGPKVAGSAAFQTLECEFKPKTATRADILFSIDGVCVRKITDFTWTGMVAMGESIAVKAGTVAAQSLVVAYDAMIKNRV